MRQKKRELRELLLYTEIVKSGTVRLAPGLCGLPTILVLGSVGKVLESMLVVGLGQVSLQQLRLHPRKTVRTVL